MNDLPGWLKHATVWLLLAVGLFLGVTAWMRSAQATRFVVEEGDTLQIQRASDGHYHWPGRLNGREIEFLVDTGATGTAIPAVLADQLKLQTVGQMQSNTAGGLVNGRIVVADLVLDGGVRAERLRLAALPNLSSPLLGMDVLGKLRWQQSQGVLKIELKGGGS
jgi:aspartyl protease family protein